MNFDGTHFGSDRSCRIGRKTTPWRHFANCGRRTRLPVSPSRRLWRHPGFRHGLFATLRMINVQNWPNRCSGKRRKSKLQHKRFQLKKLKYLLATADLREDLVSCTTFFILWFIAWTPGDVSRAPIWAYTRSNSFCRCGGSLRSFLAGVAGGET